MWSRSSGADRLLAPQGASVQFQLACNRAFDVGFTLVASMMLLPLAVAVSLLIWVTSPGPALHRATRVGRAGKPFTLYKFRTMVQNAAVVGPPLTHRKDPRITRVGGILRKTKFDEFPQVINVLKGDMSIVGPRPEAPEYVRHYSAEQWEVLRMRPGLTSLAQVMHRNEEQMLPAVDTEAYYLSVVLPTKLSLDFFYVTKWSLGLDLRVFLLGVLALLRIAPPACMWPVGTGVPVSNEGRRTMASRS